MAEAATPLPVAKPEEVGMSAERLGRMHTFIGNLVERRRVAGAGTAVAIMLLGEEDRLRLSDPLEKV